MLARLLQYDFILYTLYAYCSMTCKASRAGLLSRHTYIYMDAKHRVQVFWHCSTCHETHDFLRDGGCDICANCFKGRRHLNETELPTETLLRLRGLAGGECTLQSYFMLHDLCFRLAASLLAGLHQPPPPHRHPTAISTTHHRHHH